MKYVPFIAPVVVSVFAFLAASWLDAPSWVGTLTEILIVVVLTSLLLVFLVLQNFPTDFSLTPKPDAFTPSEVKKIETVVSASGFRIAGPPLEASIRPPGWMLMFTDGKSCLATFIRTGTVPRAEVFDISSSFDLPGRPGLTTVGSSQAATFPAPGLALKQCFDGQSFEELFEHHQRTLELVRSRGVPLRPADPSEAEALAREEVTKIREDFIRRLPLSLCQVLWRAVTKRTPYKGPVATQESGQRALAQLEELAAGRRAAEGPPRPF